VSSLLLLLILLWISDISPADTDFVSEFGYFGHLFDTSFEPAAETKWIVEKFRAAAVCAEIRHETSMRVAGKTWYIKTDINTVGSSSSGNLSHGPSVLIN
jgi:hypothetical protein